MFLRNHLYFTSRASSVTVPFQYVNNLMVIPLRINNSDTLRFILDTGVKTALITGLSGGEVVQLNGTRKIKIRGLGEGEELEALLSYGNRFDILSQVRGDNHDVLVLTDDIFFLSTKLGMHVHGIIGYDVFKNFIVEIDYQLQRLTLHRPEKFKRKPANLIPMAIDDGKPYVQAEVEIEEGKKLPMRLLIDTGASYALALETLSDPRLTLPARTIDAYLGRGLSGDIWGKQGRIKSFSIGKYKFKNLVAAFPDSLATIQITGMAKRNGQIGAEVLKRFKLIIDYPNGRLFLRPSEAYKKPFYHSLSGVEIISPMPGVPVYQVGEISRLSPAEAAGLQRGDELLDINGRKTFLLSLNQIIDMMQSKPGKKITMHIRRGSEIHKIEFVLRQPI